MRPGLSVKIMPPSGRKTSSQGISRPVARATMGGAGMVEVDPLMDVVRLVIGVNVDSARQLKPAARTIVSKTPSTMPGTVFMYMIFSERSRLIHSHPRTCPGEIIGYNSFFGFVYI
jgi:hypothetical protein